MKKILYFIVIAVSLVGITYSCTDDFDETNMNPNKIYETQPDYVFPGIAYKSIYAVERMNYQLTSVLSRYIVNWVEQKDTENMDYIFEDFYVKSLNDLAKLERSLEGNEGLRNQYHIMKVWKSYLYYIMVSSFGGVPMSEASLVSLQTAYKYDTEEEIYNVILADLDAAVEGFDVNGDKMYQDPVFHGESDFTSDIAKWRTFANSLRLQIALTAQNLNASLAEEHIRKALTGTNADYLISSTADIAKFKFGLNDTQDASFYYIGFLKSFESGQESGTGRYPAMSHDFFLYMKSYDDPRLPKYVQKATGAKMPMITDTLTQVNATNPNLRDSVTVRYGLPYVPRRDFKDVPVGYEVSGTDPSSPTSERTRSPYSDIQVVDNECFVNREFLKPDGEFVMISYADVCFMKAEVAVKYPGVVPGTAQQYYEDGIRASMQQYGVAAGDINTYMTQPGVAWNTDGEGVWEYRHFYKADIKGVNNPLEQIYKQWYIANFFYGHAGWTLERRTRALNFHPHFYNGTISTEGSNGICDYMQERLLYPQKEQTLNSAGYYQGASDLQANSPAPNPARNGDNFFTLLRIAAPQTGDINVWANARYDSGAGPGMIYYDGSFVRHWYGSTREEVLATCGIPASNTRTEDRALATQIRYEPNSLLIVCTYDPETGLRIETDPIKKEQYATIYGMRFIYDPATGVYSTTISEEVFIYDTITGELIHSETGERYTCVLNEATQKYELFDAEGNIYVKPVPEVEEGEGE